MNTAPSDQQTRRPFTILVTQLGGLDDIARTLMALRAAQHLYPNLESHLLVLPKYRELLQGISWINQVMSVPQDPAVSSVAAWVSQVIDQKYDLSINWTVGVETIRVSGMIHALVPALVKLGVTYSTEQDTLISLDAWSVFHEAWVRPGIHQDIHLTDIITTQLLTALQIHIGDPQPVGSIPVANRGFFGNQNLVIQIGPQYKWIVLESDSLPVDCSDLAKKILTSHQDVGLIVVGSGIVGVEPSDRLIHISAASPEISVQVLMQANWVISGVSDWVPLASLMGVRVLQVTENDPRWWSHGPYSNGSWLVTQVSLGQEDDVYEIWSQASSPSPQRSFGTQQVWYSRIRTPEDGGGVVYEKLKSNPMQYSEWMGKIRGQLARSWFCGWAPEVENEVSKMHMGPELIRSVRILQESVPVLKKIFTEGRELALRLASQSSHLRNQHLMSVSDKNAVEEYSKKLLEVEALFSRVTQVDPELLGLLKLYQQFMHNLKGQSIAELAKETADVFEMLSDGLELINTYGVTTLNMARPKPVVMVGAASAPLTSL